jgi:hypothetical protein
MKSNKGVLGEVIEFKVREAFGTPGSITGSGGHRIRRIWMLRFKRMRCM